MTIFIGIIEQGLTYSLLALGVYISYQILGIPDLTIDGSFPLGAAVCVIAIVAGLNPALTLVLSFIAGCLAGLSTGLIHVKLGIKDFLAGIIMQTALYTINLLIAGRANVPIFANDTIFNNSLATSFGDYRVIFIMLPFVLLVKLLLDMFLRTKAGFLLKATGDNPLLVKTLAKDPGQVKIYGLSLSNGLVALSGGIVAQEQGFFEISMGTGAMVMGLASLVLGIKALEKLDFFKDTTKVIIGSIFYKGAIALAIALGFSANSMKLITATIFLVILVAGDAQLKIGRGKDD